MTAVTTFQQEIGTDALFEVSFSGPRRRHTLRFSVTKDGAIGFDNRQPDARVCAGRRASLALASEMLRAARSRDPDAQRGRTLRGLAYELRVHNRAYRLGLFRSSSVTTEMGSPASEAPDYDHNAVWFEHPLRSLPQILRWLFTERDN